MALEQLAPAQEVSQVELPRASSTAKGPLHVGRHMQPLQKLDHALLYTGWYAGVQSPCTRTLVIVVRGALNLASTSASS